MVTIQIAPKIKASGGPDLPPPTPNPSAQTQPLLHAISAYMYSIPGLR